MPGRNIGRYHSGGRPLCWIEIASRVPFLNHHPASRELVSSTFLYNSSSSAEMSPGEEGEFNDCCCTLQSSTSLFVCIVVSSFFVYIE